MVTIQREGYVVRTYRRIHGTT